MRTRKVQLNEQTEFHEKDVAETRADKSECRRLKAETVEVFNTIRSQLDIFEKRVLSDYDRFEARCDARLERLEGRDSGTEFKSNEGGEAKHEVTGSAEVHELNRKKAAAVT